MILGLNTFFDWLGNTEAAFLIGATWWFPLLESVHVLAFCFLVGVMLIVDWRLLGRTAMAYRLNMVIGELVPWAWGAFALAVVTGLALFVSRPSGYAANPAFQIKMLLLVVAGANVWHFHARLWPRLNDGVGVAPRAGRLAGLASLCVWLGIILAGRWTGHLT